MIHPYEMANNRPRRRKTRAQNMEIIKRVTMELLNETGYTGMSVNKIAEASGINISQVYRYFPNGKPDILLAIGNDIVEEGGPDPDLPEYQDPRSLLSALTRFLIETHRKNKTLLASMQAVFLSNPKTLQRDAEAISTGDSDFSVIEAVVERSGVEDASLRKETARHIFHLLDTMIHRQVIETKITQDDEALIALLSDMVLAYLDGLRNREH
jgi:AcrR family transcriptional regulator